MIFYGTKAFMKEFKAGVTGESELSKSVREKVLAHEQGQELLEWVVHSYYYDRIRCIQIMNIATNLTIFVVQNDYDNIKLFPTDLFTILLGLYGRDSQTSDALMNYLNFHALITYVPLNNKSVLSSLSHFKSNFMDSGYRIEKYLNGNKLDFMAFNWDSTHYLMSKKTNDKVELFEPYDLFKERILKEYT